MPPVGTPSAAKTGAARGKSRPHCRQVLLLPLPPRRRTAVIFLLADETRRLSSSTPALQPVATKVRTIFPTLWTPWPSSRGGTRRSHPAAAPPPLVMAAIEPGWHDFLAGAAAFTNARAPFAYLA
jgi:hypothetical protein